MFERSNRLTVDVESGVHIDGRLSARAEEGNCMQLDVVEICYVALVEKGWYVVDQMLKFTFESAWRVAPDRRRRPWRGRCGSSGAYYHIIEAESRGVGPSGY